MSEKRKKITTLMKTTAGAKFILKNKKALFERATLFLFNRTKTAYTELQPVPEL